MKWHGIVTCMVIITIIAACGCTSVPINQSGNGGPAIPKTGNLTLSSPAFPQGGSIPDLYTCKGQNISPPLSWQKVPTGAKSLALIVIDTDAPVQGGFTHWIVYNIPPNSTGLAEGQPQVMMLPDGAGQGINSLGSVGYSGPCPPAGSPHHYHFRLHALDTVLATRGSVNRSMLEGTLQGHVLESTELIGVFPPIHLS